MKDHYFIECRIERGAFTNERTFEIDLSSEVAYRGEKEGKLVGTAHADHLRDHSKNPLGDEPGYGEVIDGFVACHVIRELANGWVLVEVPSADVIHVSKNSLVAAD